MTGFLFSILWIWCVLLWILNLENKKITILNMKINGRILYLVSAFIPIFFVMGFRSAEVGTDTWNYAMNIFPTISDTYNVDDILSQDDTFGRGYWLFFYALGNFFSTHPEVYIIGESLLVILGTAVFIYRTTSHVALATLIFLCCFFVSALSLARQYVGIVVAVNAAICIFNDKKSIIGWGLLLLTLQIHAVNAIILIGIVLGLISIRIKKPLKTFLVAFIFMVISGIMVEPILTAIISNFIPEYMGYLNTSWSQNVLEGESGLGLGVLMMNLIYLLAVLLVCFKIKDATQSVLCKKLYYAILPTAVIASVAGIVFHNILVMPRVFSALLFLGIPLVSTAPYYYTSMKRLFIEIFILFGISVGFFRVFLAHEYLYTFFWEM